MPIGTNMNRKTILATRKLSSAGKAMLKAAGIAVADYDAIDIKLLQTEIPGGYQHLIFSSQNGVKAFLAQLPKNKVPLKKEPLKCYCVGGQTRGLLEANGLQVVASAANAKSLAQTIIKTFSNERFLFLCGNRRRDDLPGLLKEHKIPLTELVVYETRLQPATHKGPFDGILFFSPSGVESYYSANRAGEETAFCIGPATATAASSYTERYVSAPEARIEAVLQLVIRKLGVTTTL